MESIQQEYVTLIKTYTPNIGAPKSTEQTLTHTKGKTDNNTVTVGDFKPIDITGFIIQTENHQQQTWWP